MSSLEWICRDRYVRPILSGINQSLKGDPKAIGADLEAMKKDGTLKLNEGKYIFMEENTTTTNPGGPLKLRVARTRL
jgi:hypothetical protein